MAVTWNYNGAATLVVAMTGLAPTTAFALASDEGNFTEVDGTSDGSGNLTLTATDVSSPGPSSLDLMFDAIVFQNASAFGGGAVAANVFTYGVASTTGDGVTVTSWAFNAGTSTVTCIFPTVAGYTYRLYDANGGDASSTVAGDGTDKTLTMVIGGGVPSPTPVVLAIGAGTFADGSVADRIFTSGVSDSGIAGNPGGGDPPPPPVIEGRVLIAFDDTPLAPSPTWTRIDNTDNLVSGYDIETGKQTELDRTDTGTATVFLNDTTGDYDPNNVTSPYFGKLVGKQIMLQLWNPVTSAWVEEWRGKIRNYGYAIKDVLGGDGKPIVANIQVECVDIFDYLGGYGLQPGVDGDVPPAGHEGIVFFEDTAGTVDDRLIQALTNAGIDSTRWVVFSGNVRVTESLYDPGDAMLTVLRDGADAEFPGLANIYVDRFGRFVFHGRRARFDPEGVIADGPVSADTWDFHRWKVGDGTAITGDSDYAQIRVLGYTHGEDDIVNSAISWPTGMADKDMPGQVFEDATSITNHGKHSLPPMGDLIIASCPTTGNTPKVECHKFAEFFVHYLKDPQTRITEVMVKAISPTDPRAASTWAVLTKADISDIMRTTVGYPGGTGIDSDNYIEGYVKRVRPLNPTHDYVEVEFNLTPTAWAMDPDGILAPAS